MGRPSLEQFLTGCACADKKDAAYSAADVAHCGMLHTVDDAAMCPVYAVEGCGLWNAANDLDDAGCCVCCVGMLRDAKGCCESCG